jgi:hypothetical protein
LGSGWLAPSLLPHEDQAAIAAPELISNAWEKLGGGQADIYYPDVFEGCWQVGSTLVSVDAPKGIEYTNDAAQIKQAVDNELNRTMRYEQCFVRNGKSRLVADRSLNTRKITEAILGPQRDDAIRYEWNIDDPNVLRMHMKGLDIFTRVTRRFSSAGDDDINSDQLTNMETSELFEQVFDKGAGAPRVKASRLITKWKWRSLANTPEGQPQIIASQTLNNYVTPIGSGSGSVASKDDLSFTNLSEPASVFKYRMVFLKTNNDDDSNSAVADSTIAPRS